MLCLREKRLPASIDLPGTAPAVLPTAMSDASTVMLVGVVWLGCTRRTAAGFGGIEGGLQLRSPREHFVVGVAMKRVQKSSRVRDKTMIKVYHPKPLLQAFGRGRCRKMGNGINLRGGWMCPSCCDVMSQKLDMGDASIRATRKLVSSTKFNKLQSLNYM